MSQEAPGQTYGPDRVALEAGEQHAVGAFAVEDVEMVDPEIDQDLFELPVGIERAVQLLIDQLGVHQLLWLPVGQRCAAKVGQIGERLQRDHAQNLPALLGIERAEERPPLRQPCRRRRRDAREESAARSRAASTAAAPSDALPARACVRPPPAAADRRADRPAPEAARRRARAGASPDRETRALRAVRQPSNSAIARSAVEANP